MGAVTSLAIACMVAAAAACSGSAPSASASGIGAPAPPLTGTTLDGGTFDLAAHRGKPVVVNFWASWCGPCRAEFPVLTDAEAAHADDGLVVVGVVYEDSPEAAAEFVEENGAHWPSMLDPGGTRAAAYRVVAPPQSYFIDEDGILRGIQIGELTTEDFERQYAAIDPTAAVDREAG